MIGQSKKKILFSFTLLPSSRSTLSKDKRAMSINMEGKYDALNVCIKCVQMIMRVLNSW